MAQFLPKSAIFVDFPRLDSLQVREPLGNPDKQEESNREIETKARHLARYRHVSVLRSVGHCSES
jgi:hypothetical protein